MRAFTNRVSLLEEEGAYAMLARAQQLEAQGRRIIHLEIGQPDFPTPDTVSRAGIRAIQDGKTKYTPPAGMPVFREKVAEYAGKQRNLHIDPTQVVISPGSKPGLFLSTLALVSPGDEVIYPDPGFPTYAAMIRVAGGIPIPITLREENGFSFDLDMFDDRISDATRMIILNSPGNPTGGVIPLADLQHIAEKAIQHDAWVLSDEIYARFVYDGAVQRSIAELDGMSERTVIVDGFSKTFSMTGWRLGFAIAPALLAQKLELLLTHATGCTATFTQYAGMEALAEHENLVPAMVREYQARRDVMLELVHSIPGIHAQTPQGAFYIFPNIRSTGLTAREVTERLLNEAGVAVLAGTDFGAGGEGYIRIVYAVAPELIEEGLTRIADWFTRL